MSCYNPRRNPLNGFSANTESGRLRKQIMMCSPPIAQKVIDTCSLSKPIQEIKPVITPSEGSYLASKMIEAGTSIRSGAVPQDVAKALLNQITRQQFVTEGVRIGALEQRTLECSTNPFSETARFSNYERIPEPFICPPLPPPPGPPAPQCILQKNQKFY